MPTKKVDGQTVDIAQAEYDAMFPAPTLDEQKAAKITAAYANCDARITAGYSSSALGSAYTYPSAPTDQANMTASVTASLLPDLAADWTTPFWCADANGAWAMRDHTAAQIQQAGSDGKTMIVTCQMNLATLTAAITAATDQAALDAVDITTGWPA